MRSRVMTISDEGRKLRAEILRLGSDHRSRRYPPELRNQILEWVERARLAGYRESECGNELGVTTKRFATWRAKQHASSSKALVRVKLRNELPYEPSMLAFVAPNGHRIEGLSLQQATALLREFS